jgi:hypothetical protein
VTVAGRIATGTALLILLLVAALVFHLSVVRRLAASNHALSSDTIDLVVRALDTLRALERIDESARKLAVTGDPGYAVQLTERRREVAAGLGRIRSSGLTPSERSAAERLDAAWREFVAVLPNAVDFEALDSAGERARLLAPALGRIVALREGAQGLVSAANELELARQGRRAAEELDAPARGWRWCSSRWRSSSASWPSCSPFAPCSALCSAWSRPRAHRRAELRRGRVAGCGRVLAPDVGVQRHGEPAGRARRDEAQPALARLARAAHAARQRRGEPSPAARRPLRDRSPPSSATCSSSTWRAAAGSAG